MVRKFPPVLDALKGARPLEPYQYYAHLPYRRSTGCRRSGYAIIGDAAWFTDALYSIGIETACRQLMNVDAASSPTPRAASRVCAKTVAQLNHEFDLCQTAVVELNRSSTSRAGAGRTCVMQTALYELGEIAELYHLQDPDALDAREAAASTTGCSGRREEAHAQPRALPEEALADGDRDLDEAGS